MEDLDGDVRSKLLAEMAWIRRLALALMKDVSAADDVAQEAWLAAADRVPDDRPVRPWLRRVVLNLVRMRGRGAQRRVKHETEAAGVEADARAPAADELVERVETQRMLSGEVLALDEPYRSTVLLHYVDDLSCAEIARQLDVPDGTVRRRLKVALDRLRDRLAERQREPKRSWVLALAPILQQRNTIAGVVTMKKWIAAAVVLVLVLLVGGYVWKRGDGGEGSGASAGGSGGAGGAGTVGIGVDGRELRGGGAIPVWATHRGAPPRKIAGHVYADGAPLAGATVRLGLRTFALTQPIAERTSAADGSFDFGMQPAAQWSVSADATGRTPADLVIETADPSVKSEQLALTLGVCRARLYGAIVDASGGPIPRARLRVAGLAGTDADDKGNYSLCVPGHVVSNVRIEADGYSSSAFEIAFIIGEFHHDFDLVPESVLAGHVVDDLGAPVPGARVAAMPDPSERVHHVADSWTVADGDGKFRVTNLAPARFRLVAFADGMAVTVPKLAVATPGAAGRDIELVLVRNTRISGRVVMAGQPVAGAHVTVDGGNSAATRSISGADGSFTIDNVARGKVKLVARPYDVAKPKELVVDKPAIDNVTLEVTALATVTGRVTRHDKPVPGATVECPPLALEPTTTDADGEYRLRGIAPGTCEITAAEMSSVMAFGGKPVTVAAGEQKRFDIELVSGGRARGIVVDEAGKPVPGVYVRLANEAIRDIGESMTDAKGEFECVTMVGGDYEVGVFASPAGGTAFPPASGEKFDPVHVKDGDDVVTGLRLAIKHELLSIRGHVVDDAGAAVPDVHVEAFGRRGFTLPPSVRADGTGNFEIGNLTRGNYVIHAHAADGSEAEMKDIAAGTTSLEVRLVRPGSIEGTVAGFTSPPTIRALQVTQNLFIGNDAVLEGDRFTIPGLAPGTYRVEARAGSEIDGAPVVVKPGAVARVALAVRGRGSVEGHLYEYGTKTPIAGARCNATLSAGGVMGTPDPQNSVTSDAQGRFIVQAPIGRARVFCDPSDGAKYTNAGGDIDVAAGAPAAIDLYEVKVVAPPADVGFGITPITLPLIIRAVEPGGPAAAAGLLAGDRLVTIDGGSLAGLLPFSAQVLAMNHRPGSTLTLGIDRGGTPMTIKIPITKLAN